MEQQKKLREERARKAREAAAAHKKKKEIEAELDQEDDDATDEVQFTDYAPQKLRGVGLRHPDPVVENASLSAVEPPALPADALADLDPAAVAQGKLSALQLESVAYANVRFGTRLATGERRGFFIGDGAGMGKGRQLAGIIAQHWARGIKRHIWVSVSNDLRFDAERDLRDIGSASIQVVGLNKVDYDAKSLPREGVVFTTYASLIASRKASAKRKAASRFNQLMTWCGGAAYQGCLLFDESHKAKNLFGSGTQKATKTGQAVLNLQSSLPDARVVYVLPRGYGSDESRRRRGRGTSAIPRKRDAAAAPSRSVRGGGTREGGSVAWTYGPGFRLRRGRGTSDIPRRRIAATPRVPRG